MRFMKELPKHIRRDIYKDFLFKDFMYLFKSHFLRLVREDSNGRPERAFWGWEDNAFQQFMIKLLQSLEPRFYHKKQYIFDQGEEVNEQIYITSGSYSIGFHLNNNSNQTYFHVKLKHKTIIGGYENLLGYESEFYYKALNFTEGYGLRKCNLKPIMTKFPDISRQIS
jgi:hypothetical protein